MADADEVTTVLGEVDGKPVVAAEAKIMKAGDGLSDTLRLAPVAYRHGSELTVVLRTRVTEVAYPEVKNDPDRLRRVHRLDTMHVVVLGPEQERLVEPILQENLEWLRRKRQAEEGIAELFDDEEDTSGLGPDEGGPDDPLRAVIGD